MPALKMFCQSWARLTILVAVALSFSALANWARATSSWVSSNNVAAVPWKLQQP